MAEKPLTLAQLVTINDRNLQDTEIGDFLNASPFMNTMAASVSSYDTQHLWIQYTQDGAAGWRDANDGREMQISTDVKRQANCTILDASFRTDLALAESYRKGGASGFMSREATRHLSDAFFVAEKQVFNGRGTAIADPLDGTFYSNTGTGNGDDSGFNGLPNYASMGTVAGGMVVDAGATAGGADAVRESVYVVRSGDADVQIITGRSGNIDIGDTNVQETAGATGTYPALYTPITAWYAVQVGSTVTSAVRIANIANDGSAGTPMDDDLLYSAISKFGSGRQPTHIFMSRRMLEALRTSRTATNPSGDPAPRPTSIEGIPIIPTDGILAGEAAVA